MQTAGLVSEGKPTDGTWKRLFWPTVANEHDADLVCTQGFWVCTVCAILSMILLIATGNALIGVVIGALFFLGGMGVREGSLPAAVLVFGCYALVKILSLESRLLTGVRDDGNPVAHIVTFLLLLANVRGMLLVRNWRRTVRPVDASSVAGSASGRTTGTFTDRMVNVLPARLWPGAKFLFFPLAALLLGFTLVLIAATPFVKKQVRQVQQQRQTETTLP